MMTTALPIIPVQLQTTPLEVSDLAINPLLSIPDNTSNATEALYYDYNEEESLWQRLLRKGKAYMRHFTSNSAQALRKSRSEAVAEEKIETVVTKDATKIPKIIKEKVKKPIEVLEDSFITNSGTAAKFICLFFYSSKLIK